MCICMHIGVCVFYTSNMARAGQHLFHTLRCRPLDLWDQSEQLQLQIPCFEELNEANTIKTSWDLVVSMYLRE